MNVLITGIGGLLGSRLAHYLLEETDASIVGIDDWSCGYKSNVPRSQRVWTYDYSLGAQDSGHVNRIFDRYKFDYVFHLAAYAAEGLSPFIPWYNYRNNLLASVEVITACIKHPPRRLVFASSMAVYGPQDPPFSEDLRPSPIDPYGVAKAAVESHIRIAGEQHDLKWTIIRPHNVYGMNQDLWTPYRNVLGIWMARTLQGLPMRIYGDGSQVRAFSWVEDCVPCLWRAATSRETMHQVINLGGTQPTSILDAANLLRTVMGRGEIQHCEARHEVSRAWSTWKKSVDLLRYDDRTPLAEGLRQMWSWARYAWEKYPDRRHPAEFEIEIREGLYSYWRDVRSRPAPPPDHAASRAVPALSPAPGG